MTPPVPGTVYDGREEGPTDVVFSSESATVSSQWEGFIDPESGITEYKVSVFRRQRMRYITVDTHRLIALNNYPCIDT